MKAWHWILIAAAVGVIVAVVLFYFFPSQVICTIAGFVIGAGTMYLVGRNNHKKIFGY